MKRVSESSTLEDRVHTNSEQSIGSGGNPHNLRKNLLRTPGQDNKNMGMKLRSGKYNGNRNFTGL